MAKRIKISDSNINPAEEIAKWDDKQRQKVEIDVQKNMAEGMNELSARLKAHRIALHLLSLIHI